VACVVGSWWGWLLPEIFPKNPENILKNFPKFSGNPELFLKVKLKNFLLRQSSCSHKFFS
jgi:hypothetical protein